MEHVLLVGTEPVENAARLMQRAAEQMSSACSTLEVALSNHIGRLEDLLHNFVSALEDLRVEKPVFECAYCERELDDRPRLRQHMVDAHGKVGL